jgi:hypothetical protein
VRRRRRQCLTRQWLGQRRGHPVLNGSGNCTRARRGRFGARRSAGGIDAVKSGDFARGRACQSSRAAGGELRVRLREPDPLTYSVLCKREVNAGEHSIDHRTPCIIHPTTTSGGERKSAQHGPVCPGGRRIGQNKAIHGCRSLASPPLPGRVKQAMVEQVRALLIPASRGHRDRPIV